LTTLSSPSPPRGLLSSCSSVAGWSAATTPTGERIGGHYRAFAQAAGRGEKKAGCTIEFKHRHSQERKWAGQASAANSATPATVWTRWLHPDTHFARCCAWFGNSGVKLVGTSHAPCQIVSLPLERRYHYPFPCIGGDWLLQTVRVAPFVVIIFMDTALFYQIATTIYGELVYCRAAPSLHTLVWQATCLCHWHLGISIQSCTGG